jgi:hypothetical protein
MFNDPVSLNEMVAINFLAHAYNTRTLVLLRNFLQMTFSTHHMVLDEMRGKMSF